jgi:hypothetical protein
VEVESLVLVVAMTVPLLRQCCSRCGERAESMLNMNKSWGLNKNDPF